MGAGSPGPVGAVSMTFQRILMLLVAMTLTAPALAQRGALTVARNLEQITSRAAVILRGSVISARVERHPELTGLHTVVVTMHVKETLKGPPRSRYTFRQYIWDIRDRDDAAGYRKGDDMLLFLIAPNRYGLSSPAGSDQGRFRIRRDALGREMAVNGHGNNRLFDGVGLGLARRGIALSPESTRLLQSQRMGPVEVGELASLVRELADAGR